MAHIIEQGFVAEHGIYAYFLILLYMVSKCLQMTLVMYEFLIGG